LDPVRKPASAFAEHGPAISTVSGRSGDPSSHVKVGRATLLEYPAGWPRFGAGGHEIDFSKLVIDMINKV
jgi:hypothetical protein